MAQHSTHDTQVFFEGVSHANDRGAIVAKGSIPEYMQPSPSQTVS